MVCVSDRIKKMTMEVTAKNLYFEYLYVSEVVYYCSSGYTLAVAVPYSKASDRGCFPCTHLNTRTYFVQVCESTKILKQNTSEVSIHKVLN